MESIYVEVVELLEIIARERDGRNNIGEFILQKKN